MLLAFLGPEWKRTDPTDSKGHQPYKSNPHLKEAMRLLRADLTESLILLSGVIVAAFLWWLTAR